MGIDENRSLGTKGPGRTGGLVSRNQAARGCRRQVTKAYRDQGTTADRSLGTSERRGAGPASREVREGQGGDSRQSVERRPAMAEGTRQGSEDGRPRLGFAGRSEGSRGPTPTTPHPSDPMAVLGSRDQRDETLLAGSRPEEGGVGRPGPSVRSLSPQGVSSIPMPLRRGPGRRRRLGGHASARRNLS